MAYTKQIQIGLICLLCFGTLIGLIWLASPSLIWGAFAFGVLLILAIIFPRLAFGALCIIYPFRFMELEIEEYNFKIEYVTIFALVVLLAALINIYFLKRLAPKYHLYFGLTFGAFIGANLLSLTQTSDLVHSLMFVIKPILLFYLAYLLLPLNLITSKPFLQKILWAVWLCGVGTTILGILSLGRQFFSGIASAALRATPFTYGNFTPLGYNQNQVGEVLVASIPFALILIVLLRGKNKKLAIIPLVSALFMTAVLLLTLSRASWIALAIEIFIILFAYRRSLAQKTLPLFAVIIVLLVIVIPSSVIFYRFLTTTDIMTSSDTVRDVLTEISLDNFAKHPILGEGPGTFVESAFTNWKYLPYFYLGLQFDAHGLFQKIISELGLLGLITFGGFVAAIIVFIQKAWRQIKENRESIFIYSLAIAAIIGNAVYMIFNTSYYDSVVWLPIGLSLAIIALLANRKPSLSHAQN